jgi:hypothetical protein
MSFDDIRVVSKRDPSNAHRVYVGRPTALGNPFPVKQFGREGAIAEYRQWLWAQIQGKNPAVLKQLNYLLNTYAHEGAVEIECWCKPKACHGDVIKACLIWAMEKNDNSFDV